LAQFNVIYEAVSHRIMMLVVHCCFWAFERRVLWSWSQELSTFLASSKDQAVKFLALV